MKLRYSVNQDNQLLIRTQRFRRPVVKPGRFAVDAHNRLTYLFHASASGSERPLPARLIFEGSWQLNADYDLAFVLKGTKEQFRGDSLVIKGEIISTERDELVFEMSCCDTKGNPSLGLLKLSGAWQADSANRLTFLVERKRNTCLPIGQGVERKTFPDTIVFKGAWQLNKNQQITYAYQKTDLKRKTKIEKELEFRGFWQLDSQNRIVYILERSSSSRFEFRVQVESPTLYPREGQIRYRIGIGLRQQRLQRTLTLYGTWKFSRQAELLFEMDYGQDRFKAISFGGEFAMNKNDSLTFTLTTKQNEPLGFGIIFTHTFLKRNAAEFFLRFNKQLAESRLEAGLRIPF